jgi:hypothetical protein
MSEGRRAYGRPLSNRQPACETGTGILAAGHMTKADQDKQVRLAAALRENLRRRKAQARDAQPKKDPNQADKE